MHKHHIRRFDRAVAAYAAHRNADVCAHKYGSVVDAVADVHDLVFFALIFHDCFHFDDFVRGKKTEFEIVDADFFGNRAGVFFVIARKHDGFCALRFQFFYDFFRVVADGIRNQNRAEILTVFCDVHHASDFFDGDNRNAVFDKQSAAAAKYAPFGSRRFHTASRAFCDLIFGTVDGLSVRFVNAFCDGVQAAAFGDARNAQDFVAVFRGDNLFDVKSTFRQRAGFVKHEYICLVDKFQITRSLEKYTLSGRAADTAEKRHRNTDDKRARTTDDKERKRAIEPRDPDRTASHIDDERGQNRKYNRRDNDRGGVISCKSCDKVFGFRFLCGSVFHHVENFCDGAVVILFLGADIQNAGKVDGTA